MLVCCEGDFGRPLNGYQSFSDQLEPLTHPGSMASTRIAELAAIIAEHTKSIDEQLASEGLPSPSFDADCPPRLLQGDSKVVASRQAILDATDELQALMLGPTGAFTTHPVRCAPR